MRNLRTLSFAITLAGIITLFSGCNNEELEKKVLGVNTKSMENERRIKFLEEDNTKLKSEVSQLKDLVTTLGNAVVDLQKAEEKRKKRRSSKKKKP